MSGANYEYCPVCNMKALYVGDEDLPDGVVVLHQKCRDQEILTGVAEGRRQAAEAIHEWAARVFVDPVDSHRLGVAAYAAEIAEGRTDE